MYLFPLALEPTAEIKKVYETPFRLALVITLSEHQLTTGLHVYNMDPVKTLEFQALFHNYIRSDSASVLVKPLQNVHYYDKTEKTDEQRAKAKKESRVDVDVKKVNPMQTCVDRWLDGFAVHRFCLRKRTRKVRGIVERRWIGYPDYQP